MANHTSTTGGAERRRFARHPINLEALLVVPQMPPINCVAKDFCVAGMYLTMARDALASLQPQTRAQLFFALVVEGQRRDLQLDISVCRITPSGVGIAFRQPPEDVVLLLQGLITDGDQHPGEITKRDKPRAKPKAKFKQLVAPLTDIAGRHINLITNEFMRTCNDQLVAAARDAHTHREQSAFLDAESSLKRARESVRDTFETTLLRGLAELRNLSQSEASPDATDNLSKLSLVDKDEFEEFLTVSEHVAEFEESYDEPLYFVGRRLSDLANEELGNAANPLGPSAIFSAAAEAMKSIAFDRQVGSLVYNALAKSLTLHLGRLYDDINEHLMAHGVLPNLKREEERLVVRKHPVSTRPSQAGLLSETTGHSMEFTRGPEGTLGPPMPYAAPLAVPEGGPPPGTVQAARPSTMAHGLHATFGTFGAPASYAYAPSFTQARSVAQQQIALRRQLLPSTPVHDATTAPVYSDQQIISGLNALQRDLVGEESPTLYDVERLKERVAEVLQEETGVASGMVGDAHGDSFEVIVSLFKSLLRDPLLTDFAKAQLMRLQGSVHKTALVDENFFVSPEHPLRQVLNRVARLHGGDAEEEIEEAQRVASMLADVNQRYEHDPAVFEPVVAQLEQILKLQQGGYSSRVAEVVRVAEDQQALLQEHRDESPDSTHVRTNASSKILPEWAKWLDRSKALEIGDRMIMQANTPHPYVVTLAWIGQDFNPYVFVDKVGKKSDSLTLQQVAMYLRRGVLKSAPSSDDGAVDRALFGVVNQMHDQVEQRATRDELTGFLDRKTFLEQVDQHLPATDDERGAVLCQLAIQELRSINSQYGEDAGDAVIAAAATRVRELFERERDDVFYGRLSGGEFGVYLCKATARRVTKKLQQLLDEPLDIEIDAGSETISPPSISVGLLEVSDNLVTAEALLKTAAQACETARSQSSRTPHLAGAEIKERRHVEQFVSYVEKALVRDRLTLLGQEIRSVNGDEPAALRLVLSAEDNNGKLLPPALFSQAAASSNFGLDIDMWTLRSCLEWMAGREEELEHYAAIILSLSPGSLRHDDIASLIMNEFMQSTVPPARVFFEVADHAAVENLTEAADFINTMRDFGCRFILGEFGGGHGDYEYVKELAVDFVSLNPTYIVEAKQNPKDFAMAKSLNELVHFMGKRTIAKQHNEKDLIETMREIGVDFFHDVTKTTRIAA